MSSELAGMLLETTLATSAASLVVLALRRPLRRLAGARVAYGLWLLLPVAALAVLLPARTLVVDVAAQAPVAGITIGAVLDAAASTPARLPGVLWAWLAGAIATALVLGLQQHRFQRSLGRLQPRAGATWQAERGDAGPAVVGLLRSRIVLPSDFETRYDALERELVLRHEHIHLARRDPLANVVASVLRCVYWFNPLLHYAVDRFRFDQELAVDAAVLAQRPGARRAYADAMLKTQLAAMPPPLGCHWQSAHPLKERIQMLKLPSPGAARIAAGITFATLLAASTGYAAWASQPAQVETRAAAAGAPVLQASHENGHKPPRYPKDAIERQASGSVVLLVDVAADGSPQHAELSPERSTPDIDASLVAAAQEAVMQWRFEPARDADGTPKAAQVLVPIEFRADEAPAADALDAPAPKSSAEPADATPTQVTFLEQKPPRYPKAAIDERRSGTVILRVLVGIDGRTQQVEVDRSSGSDDLDAAAIAAAREWSFNPAHDGYKPVPAWIGVPVNFELDETAPTDAAEAPAASGARAG